MAALEADDPLWVAWAPPLNPPTEGGLPRAIAEQIATLTGWPADQHWTAAEQWEAYAATLEPTPAVSQVATGVQSVTYSPAVPAGPFGLALARAQWHRTFLDSSGSVPLGLSHQVTGRGRAATFGLEGAQ